jgi:molybdate transport system substrate-binding protein
LGVAEVPTEVAWILSAGAARKVVRDLLPDFEARIGAPVETEFGAVGAMADLLAAGHPCDLLITSKAVLDRLHQEGVVRPGAGRVLGMAQTSLAVRSGDPLPDISTPDAFARSLLTAEAIFCPDVERATAGIHLASVLGTLGIAERLRSRLRVFPNGAAAMSALVGSDHAGSVGCTQEPEIIDTDGATVVGPLPEPYGLTTSYWSVDTSPGEVGAGAQLLELLRGDRAREVAQRAGFAPG